MDNVYTSRNQELSREMGKHYEDLYKENKLKGRIKGYIKRVQSDSVNEKDPDIKALMKDVKSNESAASPRGSQHVDGSFNLWLCQHFENYV